MPPYGNRIEKRVKTEEFSILLLKYREEQIDLTEHTFFRLSGSQRKIYTKERLRKIIKNEAPFLAGRQYNGNYALFYRYENKVLKVILSIADRKINIVTFYFIGEWQIPKL